MTLPVATKALARQQPPGPEPAPQSQSLTFLAEARTALTRVSTVDEAKAIRDKAEALRVYAKQAQEGTAAQNQCAEIKIRAERRAGELLAETVKKGKRADNVAPRNIIPDGVSRTQSSRWQQVASVPESDFEKHVEQVTAKGGELTTAGVTRLAKERRREGKREANRELVQDAKPLPLADSYQAIVLDPPWDWGDEGDQDQLGRAKPTYDTMSIGEITALPVADLATDNAHIYLWITNRSLPKGFALLEAWGFRYVTALTWVKPSFGMGNYFRGSTEHVLFGVRGKLPLLRSDVGTHFEAPRQGGHSTKPDAFFELVESCSPGPWLEMFSRRQRAGWAAWGAEA